MQTVRERTSRLKLLCRRPRDSRGASAATRHIRMQGMNAAAEAQSGLESYSTGVFLVEGAGENTNLLSRSPSPIVSELRGKVIRKTVPSVEVFSTTTSPPW